MHLHILGICGTFMGGIAQIARALGHRVTGSDLNVYPPMSDHLQAAGIEISSGYSVSHLKPAPDLVLIGNALSRGNEAVEYVLSSGLHYDSGPAWLRQAVLRDRQVIAVAGTHGKTTTTSLITWLLEANGYQPGYLIGGRANTFDLTASLGQGDIFVIEADEYDTAFFDKRSKFIHYQPDIFIINNLEFDHADIFNDISDIQRQFHHAVRTVPANGLIVANADSVFIAETLSKGCWTPVQTFGQSAQAEWQLQETTSLERYEISRAGDKVANFHAPIAGLHNAMNTTAAIIAASHVGLSMEECLSALTGFAGVKRRLDNYADVGDIHLYDDFAHHPTAIRSTLRTMLGINKSGRTICILEPRSNTMQNGTHRESLKHAFEDADLVYLFEPGDIAWNLQETADAIGEKCLCYKEVGDLITAVCDEASDGDHIVIMSNGGFQGLHAKLHAQLLNRGDQ